jgi:MFS family permease
MQNLKNNIIKMYFFRFFSSFWLIVPVLIPYYKSAGLAATQVFLVQSVFLTAVFLLEIPSGYLADIIGRKKTIIIGTFFLPAGLLTYYFSSSLGGFIAAELMIAVALSFWSGADSALIYDTLKQLKKQGDYKKIQGTAEMLTRVGDGLASVTGGLLALLSLKLPFIINIATSLVMLPVLFTIAEPGRKMMKAGENHAKQLAGIVVYSMTHKKIRPYIILSGIVNGAGIIGVWAYLLYYGQLGLNVAYNGIFHACLGFASGIGAAIAYKVEKKLGVRIALSLLFIIALGFCMFGGFKSYFVIPFAFINGFIWNMSFPIILDLMNRQVKSEMRATVISVSSMARSVVFVVFSPLFGWVTDKYSLSSAFFGLAALFALVTAWSLFELVRNKEI